MTEHDNPYDLLISESDDQRWAYGTGFTDPLAGVDTAVPEGIDAGALGLYCLMLGDDALILSHRLQQWITRLPELEEETAIANIALDLLGQARLLLARAASADPSLGAGEDELAFFRSEPRFRNVRLVERADADFAELVARLFVFATWRLALFERLSSGADPVLRAIAAKGVSEVAYHRDYAAQWVIRLGDGTDTSHERMRRALETVWPLLPELFTDCQVETELPGVAVAASSLREPVDAVLDTVLAAGLLTRPQLPPLGSVAGKSGRDGVHTEALGYVLAELQSVARALPDAIW
jgi:ring-1,2-phenylacetyl-CoA epoxidase subunit PaaC